MSSFLELKIRSPYVSILKDGRVLLYVAHLASENKGEQTLEVATVANAKD